MEPTPVAPQPAVHVHTTPQRGGIIGRVIGGLITNAVISLGTTFGLWGLAMTTFCTLILGGLYGYKIEPPKKDPDPVVVPAPHVAPKESPEQIELRRKELELQIERERAANIKAEAEQRRVAEEQRRAEDARRKENEQRMRAQAERDAAEQRRLAEEARVAAEKEAATPLARKRAERDKLKEELKSLEAALPDLKSESASDYQRAEKQKEENARNQSTSFHGTEAYMKLQRLEAIYRQSADACLSTKKRIEELKIRIRELEVEMRTLP